MALAAATAVLAAGCLGSGSSGQPAITGQTTETTSGLHDLVFRAHDCTMAALQFHTTRDKAEPYVPAGFNLTSPRNAPSIQLKHLACQKLVIHNGTEVSGYTEVQIRIPVDPPDDLAAPRGRFSSWLVHMWVNNETIQQLMLKRGLPVSQGEYVQDSSTLVSEVWGTTVGRLAAAESNEGWSLTLLSDDYPVDSEESYRTFFGYDDPSFFDAEWRGNMSNQDYGGVVRTSQGSLLASLGAAGPVQAYVGGIGEGVAVAKSFSGG